MNGLRGRESEAELLNDALRIKYRSMKVFIVSCLRGIREVETSLLDFFLMDYEFNVLTVSATCQPILLVY
jgi:hypothetical protein